MKNNLVKKIKNFWNKNGDKIVEAIGFFTGIATIIYFSLN
jgi:hypothetical protein